MMTAREAQQETNLVTETEIARREQKRVRKAAEAVMSEAAKILEAAIQDKQYEAVVDVSDVGVMILVEKKLRHLGYKTLGAPGSLYVRFSWDKKYKK